MKTTTWPIIYQYDEPQNVVIRVDSTDNMTSAGKACADVLNNYLSPKDDTIQYKAKDLLEQAQQIQELSSSTNTMLIWIAGISLIVGGITSCLFIVQYLFIKILFAVSTECGKRYSQTGILPAPCRGNSASITESRAKSKKIFYNFVAGRSLHFKPGLL